jgi:hypothetical protein
LRFQNPDGTWGDYTDLKGESGSAAPSGVLPHFLADCLEKKVQVYTGLYRFYRLYLPDSPTEPFLEPARHILLLMLSVGVDYTTPGGFVEAGAELAEREKALVEGPLAYLVDEGHIAEGLVTTYASAIDYLEKIIKELDSKPTAEEALAVTRAVNRVSLFAAMLLPAGKS